MGFEGADIGLHNIGELIPDLLWQWGWRVHKNVSYATLTLTGKKVLDHLPERLRSRYPHFHALCISEIFEYHRYRGPGIEKEYEYV